MLSTCSALPEASGHIRWNSRLTLISSTPSWKVKNGCPIPITRDTTPNGIGDTNHYFYMPPGEPTPLAKPSRLRRMEWSQSTFSQRRVCWRAASGPYGSTSRRWISLYRWWWSGTAKTTCAGRGLPVIVDNLIAQRRIQPVALAMIDNGGTARMVEYACSEASLLFLLSAVLPLAKAQLNLLDITAHPASFGVMGASMGGLMALYTALRLPHIFGRTLCQSGAYAF